MGFSRQELENGISGRGLSGDQLDSISSGSIEIESNVRPPADMGDRPEQCSQQANPSTRGMRPARLNISAAGVVLFAVLISSCFVSGDDPGPIASNSTSQTLDLFAADVPPLPDLDPTAVQEGEAFYGQYCASCHGTDLSGEENWMIRQPDGSYPAPPHDESGHTWHHSDELLLELIGEGPDFAETRMPTFSDQLSDTEILAIVEYLKSEWGLEQREFQWQVTWQELQRSS